MWPRGRWIVNKNGPPRGPRALPISAWIGTDGSRDRFLEGGIEEGGFGRPGIKKLAAGDNPAAIDSGRSKSGTVLTLNDNIISRAAVEDIQSRAAEEDIVPVSAQEDIGPVAADQDVIAGAAIRGQL